MEGLTPVVPLALTTAVQMGPTKESSLVCRKVDLSGSEVLEPPALGVVFSLVRLAPTYLHLNPGRHVT